MEWPDCPVLSLVPVVPFQVLFYILLFSFSHPHHFIHWRDRKQGQGTCVLEVDKGRHLPVSCAEVYL